MRFMEFENPAFAGFFYASIQGFYQRLIPPEFAG